MTISTSWDCTCKWIYGNKYMNEWKEWMRIKYIIHTSYVGWQLIPSLLTTEDTVTIASDNKCLQFAFQNLLLTCRLFFTIYASCSLNCCPKPLSIRGNNRSVTYVNSEGLNYTAVGALNVIFAWSTRYNNHAQTAFCTIK